jgi:hypothetical protein
MRGHWCSGHGAERPSLVAMGHWLHSLIGGCNRRAVATSAGVVGIFFGCQLVLGFTEQLSWKLGVHEIAKCALTHVL